MRCINVNRKKISMINIIKSGAKISHNFKINEYKYNKKIKK
jgi:hypothetical protein